MLHTVWERWDAGPLLPYESLTDMPRNKGGSNTDTPSVCRMPERMSEAWGQMLMTVRGEAKSAGETHVVAQANFSFNLSYRTNHLLINTSVVILGLSK